MMGPRLYQRVSLTRVFRASLAGADDRRSKVIYWGRTDLVITHRANGPKTETRQRQCASGRSIATRRNRRPSQAKPPGEDWGVRQIPTGTTGASV